jgi:Ca-activated chloride channel family protein
MRLGFERPLLILLGLLIMAALFLLSRRCRHVLAADVSLGPPGGVPFRAPVNLRFLMKLLGLMEGAGVLLLFTAAAGPHGVYTETVWLNRGADILFVLDISPSMAAVDMNGRSRFEVSRELIRDFAARRPTDAVGLAVVGNDAALLAPPTTDRRSLNQRLEELSVGELGDGTALGLGLAIAARHLSRRRGAGGPAPSAVLITDGENNAGGIHPETAAALFPGFGISLWVIGVGSRGEVPFSYVDPRTRMQRTGIFDSRFDAAVLEDLARKGGGTWLAAPSAESFAAAFTALDEGEMTISRPGTRVRREPLYRPFAAAALILLVLVRFVRRVILGAPL